MKYLPKILIIISFAVAFGVLLAWLFDFQALVTILPGLASMKFNTALLFLLSSLYIYTLLDGSRFQSRIFQILPLVVSLIAAITLLEYIFHFNSPIDNLLVFDTLTDPASFPGRMSQATAILFILLSLAAWLYQRSSRLAEPAAIVTHLIALIAILGYLFDFSSLYAVTFFDTIAIHTAILFYLLSLTLIIINPKGSILGFLVGEGPGSIAARYLLPLALVVPIFFGWLTLQGIQSGLFKPAFGLVLLTFFTVGLQAIAVVSYALTIRRWYQKQVHTQTQLLESEILRLELEKEHEVNDMRDKFFAMLSHDMKTPISTIILSSDLLMNYEDRMDVDRRLNHLKKIRYQAYNISSVVEDIMLINQLQFAEIPYNPSYQDIIGFCRIYFEEFVEMESGKNHNLSSNIIEGEIKSLFDADLLKRVFNNLLRNAIKYSPDGGDILFRVRSLDNRINIAIQDQGIGIPKESLNSLFTMFNRATNVGDIKGYGLGLVIVKQIIESHKGTITVDSTVGKGSTFSISIPIIAPV